MAEVGARSLAALLLLVLTTPQIDLIVLLRRLKTPEVLLELMVFCYRMLFFSEATHDTLTDKRPAWVIQRCVWRCARWGAGSQSDRPDLAVG